MNSMNSIININRKKTITNINSINSSMNSKNTTPHTYSTKPLNVDPKANSKSI